MYTGTLDATVAFATEMYRLTGVAAVCSVTLSQRAFGALTVELGRSCSCRIKECGVDADRRRTATLTTPAGPVLVVEGDE